MRARWVQKLGFKNWVHKPGSTNWIAAQSGSGFNPEGAPGTDRCAPSTRRRSHTALSHLDRLIRAAQSRFGSSAAFDWRRARGGGDARSQANRTKLALDRKPCIRARQMREARVVHSDPFSRHMGPEACPDRACLSGRARVSGGACGSAVRSPAWGRGCHKPQTHDQRSRSGVRPAAAVAARTTWIVALPPRGEQGGL